MLPYYLPEFGKNIEPYDMGECILSWLTVELSEEPPPELVESKSPPFNDDDKVVSMLLINI